jgi:hypothetical protein
MKKLFIPVLGLLALTACDEDEPNIAPEISALEIDGKDHDIDIDAGETVQVTAIVSDDVDLGQIKFTAHNVFDGHDHGKVMAFIPFEATNIQDINGTSVNVVWEMMVSENATAGPYHILAQAFDADGNEAEFKEVNFMIENDGMAEVDVTSHDFDAGYIDAEPGETILLSGSILDDIDIAEITIKVAKHGHDDHDDHDHGKTDDDIIYEMDWDLNGSNDTYWHFYLDGNVEFTFPSDITDEEDFEITIRVTDSDGNITIEEGDFHVH